MNSMNATEAQKKIREATKEMWAAAESLNHGWSPEFRVQWKAAMEIVAELIQLGHLPGVAYKQYPCPKGLTSGCIGRSACYGEEA